MLKEHLYDTTLGMLILNQILPWVQVGLSVILIAIIVLQQNEASLGNAFGGSGGMSLHHKKRGLERGLFITTIIVAILFIASAVITLFIK